MPKTPPRSSVTHKEAFPMAGGLVYKAGKPMPDGARLQGEETREMYVADGQNNWVLKPADKEKSNG